MTTQPQRKPTSAASFPLPSRADHVGSLLRPERLKTARAQARNGSITREQLRVVQEACVREVVGGLESTGMQVITDGEFSRDWWHIDFLAAFEGVSNFPDPGVANFKGFRAEDMPPIMSVAGPIRRTKPAFVDFFRFLKGTTRRTIKQTLPSPAMLLLRGGYAALDRTAYPDPAQLWEDLGAAYRAELTELAAAGCTYVQIDDTSYSLLCDDKFRAMVRARGEDPDLLVQTYVHAVNLALRDRPPGMTVAMHTCRGNFQSSWVAEGSYERVAETVFNQVAVDTFFLEYDSDRAGGFEPLRFMPDDKFVVLGLVSTKVPSLESKDVLKRRIDEAAKFVPLERLALSPQCGFASTYHGNKVTLDDQWAKLRLVVEVADEVWR